MHTHQEILEAIALHGSVRKAAIALDITPQSITKRFGKLSKEDPLRIDYEVLKGQKGRPRKYVEGAEGDRARWRQGYYNMQEKKQEEP
ncbi:MAG TPA: hypothetical protein V6C88_10390 [Chroococcidiopsis sp.]